jgi:peptidoglycan/LPS O-acetylase OafA/YrhL
MQAKPLTAVAPVQKERVFFPNLDGWRFVSFFLVFLYHTYMTFFNNIRDSSPDAYDYIQRLFQHGNLGVNFFFVLSGFLITYLLIREREYTGRIHVPNFYVRRILRIWPLFYLCVFIGFIVFPVIKRFSGQIPHEIAHPGYYLIFANNFDFMHSWPEKPDATLLSVLWSVAVEEQFYLTWPLILSIVPFRYYKFVFPAIILFALTFRSFHSGQGEHEYAIRYFHTFSVIGDMALGGLLAFLCSFRNSFLSFVTNLNRVQIAMIYVGALTIIFFKSDLFDDNAFTLTIERLVIAFFFGMIILEQNYAKKSFFKMSRFKLISKLGTYTYGLYCLHLLGFIAADIAITKAGFNKTSLPIALIGSVLALALSIMIALLTYHLYEKWFLRLKDKFAFIVKK